MFYTRPFHHSLSTHALNGPILPHYEIRPSFKLSPQPYLHPHLFHQNKFNSPTHKPQPLSNPNIRVHISSSNDPTISHVQWSRTYLPAIHHTIPARPTDLIHGPGTFQSLSPWTEFTMVRCEQTRYIGGGSWYWIFEKGRCVWFGLYLIPRARMESL